MQIRSLSTSNPRELWILRLSRQNYKWALGFLSLGVFGLSCASLPKYEHQVYQFPKNQAWIEEKPTRPIKEMGEVKSVVNFNTLDPNFEEANLCKNYFHKAVNKLVQLAKKQGGDGVVDVRSVVFYRDGRFRTYKHAECFDDGMEGQVLARGTVFQYLPKQKGSSTGSAEFLESSPAPAEQQDPKGLILELKKRKPLQTPMNQSSAI